MIVHVSNQPLHYLVCLKWSFSGLWPTNHFLVCMSKWTLFGIFETDFIRHVYNQWPFGRNITDNCMEIPQLISFYSCVSCDLYCQIDHLWQEYKLNIVFTLQVMFVYWACSLQSQMEIQQEAGDKWKPALVAPLLRASGLGWVKYDYSCSGSYFCPI